ncbi:hypothetical protein F511_41280 [Dorcoceras hygrometricum]|uniref:Uncharacterized protein n=1 Tax=Dorcoceras hygrometricum TaxID=472368 RepID=A0A2Z7D6U1_9LAMI|nr:hypothetical protein F511_41280 [Dorcoceras hygrometricum]
MRSVVASHGPGSNPRGNAICNAILLQCFPVLQIFGLQYLDRHLHLRMPKNLKFQNRSKPGPTSHTGPKTSRAARDRPEPNPRKNQTSRHDIAGKLTGASPVGDGGAATTKSGVSVRTIVRNAAQRCAHNIDEAAHPGGGSGRPVAHHMRGRARRSARSGAHHRPSHAAGGRSGAAQRRATKTREAAASARLRRRKAARFQRRCCAAVRARRLSRPRSVRVHGASIALPHAPIARDPRLLRQTALEVLTRSARMDSPRKTRPEQIPAKLAAAAGGGVFEVEEATAFA